MKTNKYKVRAFTVLELTVVMLISAIVIGIAFTAYSMMSKAYLSFTDKNEGMGLLIRVNDLLKKDFEKSDTITFDHHILIFQDSESVVKYQIEPDFIVRTSLITDTFKVKTAGMQTSFEKTANNTDEIGENQQQIDEAQLNLLFQKDTISYSYHKVYSSQSLIKRNTYAIN